MTKEEQFKLCLERANRIVESYRAQAPNGYDPQGSWVAVGVGVVGVGAGVASAATAEGPKTYGPEDLTYKNMAALARWGPSNYWMNRIYNPAYSGLSNATAEQSLFGTPQHTMERQVYINRGHEWTPFRQRVNVPGQSGLLDIYKRAGADIGQFNRDQQGLDRQQFMQDNPLYNSILQRGQEGLDQGGNLDPSTRRSLEQAAFGDASMRGFGHSPLDAYQAYAQMGAASEARKREREQFALQAQGMVPDPFRPSFGSTAGPAIGMGGAAWSRTSSTPVMNPFALSGVQSMPSDNTTSNILGAVSGGLLNMAGGLGGMGGGAGARGPNNQMYYPAQGNAGTYYR